ncbi:MAG TPA: VOC family protein [Acidimicrobiales bacterium]|nr:VOC family protein [Acidimicrobiales bacterium]
MTVFPGRIRQFGFIVGDIDAAIAQWVALGVAPWLVMRDIGMEGCQYRGELSEPVISIGLSNSGDMQIELIQQHGETPSIYQEFMEARVGGLHQVAYWVEDLDAVRANAMAAGWTEVWRGPKDGPTGFSYLEHQDAPVAIVELMELNDGTRAMGSAIQAAGEAWTPGQPVFMS